MFYCVVLGFFGGLGWLAISTPKYTASVVLVPSANRTGVPDSKLGSLAGLASIAGGKLGVSDKTSNVDRFRFFLTSKRLAEFQIKSRSILQVLYKDRWDFEKKTWRPPSGPVNFIVGPIRKLFSFPAWQVPDEFMVVETYKRNFRQSDVGETSMQWLSYTDTSPERALWLLKAAVADADTIVRADALARAEQQAAYLRNRLKSESLLEHRETLLALLSEQEQTLMLANSNLPFTQDIMENYTVSSIPTSNTPLTAAFIGSFLGLLLGYVLAFLLLARRTSKSIATSAEAN
jgi:hypothetical protein